MNAFPDFTPATLRVGARDYRIVDLPALGADYPRLPVVLRLLLENAVRHQRGAGCAAATVAALFDWLRDGASAAEIAFQPGRVLMHDTTSTPALVDIAAMRDALAEAGADPALLNPTLPVDVSVDHSLAVEVHARGRGPRQHRPRDPPQRRALPLPALGRRRCAACTSIRPAPASCIR